MADAWVFHIQQDFVTRKSAVWAAQRVPDGHIVVISNAYVLGDIPIGTNSSDYMYSDNLLTDAISSELYKGGTFNWVNVYGTTPKPMYNTIRSQWVMQKLAPSAQVKLDSSDPSPFKLPFSVKVDKKIGLVDVFAVYRSFYEGTDHDMTKGVLAGPFGNPNRVEGGDGASLGSFVSRCLL